MYDFCLSITIEPSVRPFTRLDFFCSLFVVAVPQKGIEKI